MPLRGRVGRHTGQGGRHCRNSPEDQQTVIALLNGIPVSEGGAGGSITGRVIDGMANDALYRALVRFEDRHFPGQRSGFVDPGGRMLKLMEALSAPRPAVVPPPAPPEPAKNAPALAKKKGTVFTPGDSHNHQPTGRWAEIQENPNSEGPLNAVAKISDPREVMAAAGLYALRDKPLAAMHIQWYYSGGGKDYVEDKHLEAMLRSDAKVQAKILKQLPGNLSSGTFSGYVAITQDDYEDEDFQFAFGQIDRLDFEVDFGAGTLHAWFMDRYEWHPYYPSIYKQMDGDYWRPTNAVHAAAVELKAEGARDFWMKGEVTIPFEAIQSTADRHDIFIPPSAPPL
jgi:hypothetical protein